MSLRAVIATVPTPDAREMMMTRTLLLLAVATQAVAFTVRPASVAPLPALATNEKPEINKVLALRGGDLTAETFCAAMAAVYG